MYNLDMSDFFNRWSVNFFGLLGTGSIFICFFVVMLYALLTLENEPYNSYGTPIFFVWCFSVIISQFIIFFTTIFLLIKEFRSDFRIKRMFLLRICNNIFYRILITILIVIEFLLIIVSAIAYNELKL